MKTCSVEGCNNIVLAKGFCNKHYTRFRKYGDPTVVKMESHGMSRSKEYTSWRRMIQRCNGQKKSSRKYYFDRGITVCERWSKSFSNFLSDMGKKPFPHYQLDRIDNDGNYEPENCRWVPPVVNVRNSTAAKISESDAVKIREMAAMGISHSEIAKNYPIKRRQVCNIVNHVEWNIKVEDI